jgi:hypothetical protein
MLQLLPPVLPLCILELLLQVMLRLLEGIS